MSLKKLGVALLAVFALGAFVASSAFAAEEFKEPGSAWYTGASPGTKLSESTKPTLTTTAIGTQKLETTVATLPLKLTATGVKCTSCVIENVGTTAKATGTLEFTGVTVDEPLKCSTTSTITSKALTATVGMKGTSTTIATLKFTPTSGTTFATVELTGSECPIAGLYKVTGTAFAEASNATGVFGKTQEIKLSKTIQESAGTSTSLKFGENSAILTGALNGSLGGTTEFAAKKE